MKCADRLPMFMSPSRERGASLPDFSAGFPKELTCNHRAMHFCKHLAGVLPFGQKITLIFLLLPNKRHNMMGKKRT